MSRDSFGGIRGVEDSHGTKNYYSPKKKREYSPIEEKGAKTFLQMRSNLIQPESKNLIKQDLKLI